ncbi:response regulator transcription factor [Cytophagaceae bacterium DM2B3-1]|uniref:Response regulator transcription factor n=1 Tax=Xanthocytophaga flava TaxID=3048013 RepID=A0AAE3U547_9BACT|nr:response regulator transcription factor [Xanthocytophaga flavus]MDJ1466506.1 response regulator transcription factor [Xanthocytophaga flavus]MDJ1479162.1 response regulator transcription factor [Xanthocytophaga flavus]MDJ1492503.1 response regulator transcription factor [Xanthocytophaga flavus]
MKKIRVVLADDHTIVRNGIRSILEEFEEIEIAGEASNGAEAVEKVKSLSPDILMVDIAMPLLNGIQVTQEISQLGLPTRCLVLSMHNNEDYIMKSIEAGAGGYLLKDTTREEMLHALLTVNQGEKYFSQSVSNIIVNAYLHKVKQPDNVKDKRTKPSKKEKVVLKYIVDGLNSREIAEKLNLSVRTVDNHRASMMRRLGVKNAVELVRVAMEQKLI